ncbi:MULTISPECIES: sulfonate ABC transporter substrate-binding protein [Acinetobacter]|uniref:sulfonate ABC transporter substrate-binding protein n=1 Tax=Acinetobacter TaxID=469 RepID=UPI00029B2A35|nr:MULTISPECIES: sulfonate ABC transporter substrate-binding protein [Acinetobacter]MDA3579979.1 sulfonate ABC transporter substrate-binding protein [Acinetobacter ursingii]MDH0192445.1 sulfonate ABC transporter substrate-binding protein [Acinetobacter ursingii]MDH0808497.1 sulfonate ABC transporter substrate-binding protein [Acinetobacter ursingii]MDH2075564.1 sulfonate ABC transporter substrate-binding protein [Acinetobacter ursingii]QQT66375.1 sulfonate ABC transporter substrate-binding pro
MTRILSSSWFKFSVMTASIAGIMMLSGCAKKEAQDLTTLNIGFQKYGLLPIVKERGVLDKALKDQGITVKWVEFPAGPQLMEGLNVGSVVFGEAGEAPPIFAQAANSNLVYVANQPAAPNAEALIVPKNSTIQSVQDLKGKRIAFNKGSNVHYLLLRVLEKNQLSLNDIQVVYLPPADARAAFEKGAVDAWVIWDPFFAAAEQQIGARVLATGQNLVSNHQFYLADRKFAQNHPDVLKTLVNELNQSTEWVKTHQDDAAKLLEKPTALDFNILKTSISRMGFGVTPLSPQVINEQQQVADAFYQQKLIPQPLKIQDAILTGEIK